MILKISAFEFLLNKRALLHPLLRQEKQNNGKPLISKDILKLIKTKNKLFQSYYRSKDLNKEDYEKLLK